MNPTDKMETQLAVEELQDGGAAVLLPEGEDNPQNVKADDNSDDNDGDNSADAEEREKIREARREERRLKKQLHREKAK